MLKLTLEYDNADDAILALALLRDKNLAGGPTPTKASKISVKGTPPEKAGEGQPDPKPATTGKPAASPGTATGAAQTSGAADKKPESSSAASGAIEYPTVSAAITAAVAIDKLRVIGILKTFNAKSGKDLTPEQYADFLAALNPPVEEELS